MTIKIADLMIPTPESVERVEDSYLWVNLVNYFKTNNIEIKSASDVLTALKKAFNHEVLVPLEENPEDIISYPPSNSNHDGVVFPTFWLNTIPALLMKRYYLALVS